MPPSLSAGTPAANCPAAVQAANWESDSAKSDVGLLPERTHMMRWQPRRPDLCRYDAGGLSGPDGVGPGCSASAATSSACTIRPTSSAAASRPTTPWPRCWRTTRPSSRGNYPALLQSTAADPARGDRRRRAHALCRLRHQRGGLHRQRHLPDGGAVHRRQPGLCRADQLRAAGTGPTNLAPSRPGQLPSLLIASRFPYLSQASGSDVLASTELPSGAPLDDGSGWARLNLYAGRRRLRRLHLQRHRDDERRLGRLQRHRHVEQQHQRPGQAHPASARAPWCWAATTPTPAAPSSAAALLALSGTHDRQSQHPARAPPS